MYIHIYIYACMYVCSCLCLHVYIHIYIYIYDYLFMYLFIYIHTEVFLLKSIPFCLYVCIGNNSYLTHYRPASASNHRNRYAQAGR